MKRQIVMSWRGGKDSALALYELLNADTYEVVALLTTVAEEYRRVSHHGVREALLEQQADAIGIPLDKVYFPSAGCCNDVYEQIMGDAMAQYKAQGVEAVGFGDLFLEDLRAYRERNLARIGMAGVFPIWKRDTSKLARKLIAMGFKGYLSCAEGKLGPRFAGRAYDERLLASLPVGVDPCGEYGEFHTFVYDGPIFKRPLAVTVGEIVARDGRYYADLLLAAMTVSVACDPSQIPPV